MSNPRHCWYGFIKKLILVGYYEQSSEVAERLKQAMAEVNKETLAMPNGKERMQAVNEILIFHTKTYDGVAMELHYHKNIIKSWISQYINAVGEKGGW